MEEFGRVPSPAYLCRIGRGGGGGGVGEQRPHTHCTVNRTLLECTYIHTVM